jgi:hypothetical protein
MVLDSVYQTVVPRRSAGGFGRKSVAKVESITERMKKFWKELISVLSLHNSFISSA